MSKSLIYEFRYVLMTVSYQAFNWGIVNNKDGTYIFCRWRLLVNILIVSSFIIELLILLDVWLIVWPPMYNSG